MTDESHSTKHLINQSIVRFSSGSSTSHSFSNIVDTPLVGPIITILKTVNALQAEIGQVITYTVLVANKGNLDAQVTLYDTMPEGTSFIPNSVIVDSIPLPMASPEKGIPLGLLKVCQSLDVTFQVIVVEEPACQQLKNQATAAYYFHTPSGREVTGSSKSNTVIIPFKETKVYLVKQANTTATYVGDTITFISTIKNKEGYAIHHAIFTDVMPEGTAFVAGSVKIDQISHPYANPVDGIHLGNLPAHSDICIQFQAFITAVPPEGCIVNRSHLTYVKGDHKGKIVSNAVSLDVFDPCLTVVESVLQHRATLGDTLTYLIQITNHGNIATDVWLSHFIPEGTSYVVNSLVINGVPFGQPILPPSVPLGNLQSHQTWHVTFQVTVNSFAISPDQKGLTSQSTIQFTFRLSDDRIVSNRILSNTVHVELLRPIMDIQLSAASTHADPGTVIHYHMQVTNTGNLAADHVSLLDWISPLNVLQPGTLFVGGVQVQYVDVNQPLPIGRVAPGATVIIVYQAIIRHHQNARRLTLRVAAKYDFHVNEPVHSGTVLSNVIVIRIEHPDE
ncbi:DUF11 domain-containing protein [Paenibacillus roseipurpureus]|uniref:DUF11 domain-containing protein n=1 Tax=Paenibacillus roseopurpureus TaxID=2918901 RepID=A0AA96RHG8_9BACL|nr:DUF11 domain-containing protein [Paenibacillus sp. MBLB1832]WNR43323.1 DUF11 domain-containing protein [Paenibacillus sp. MBLB1832]